MDSGVRTTARKAESTVAIRPASLDDLRRFYSGSEDFRQYHTMRILAAELDGEVIGIGGYYFDANGNRIAFSDMWPKMRVRRKDIVRSLRAIMALIGDKHVFAVANPQEPKAERLLARLGFEHIGTDSSGEVYQRKA